MSVATNSYLLGLKIYSAGGKLCLVLETRQVPQTTEIQESTTAILLEQHNSLLYSQSFYTQISVATTLYQRILSLQQMEIIIENHNQTQMQRAMDCGESSPNGYHYGTAPTSIA